MRFCEVFVILASILCMTDCSNIFQTLDSKYQLVTEAYSIAQNLFNQGRANYISLKKKALQTIDTFLDLVYIMNEEMGRKLRSAVIKYYKIKYFHDFTNYIISLDEMVEIVEHCLADPVEKLGQIREQFQAVVNNFEDVRNFDHVAKCHKELPDEVAAAHCILHQAVLFNETMQESLVTIVKVKTRQHAQDMNISLFFVQDCINDFVPKFFDNLLLHAYTEQCGYMRVVNASIGDMMKDKLRGNETLFPDKWNPVIKLIQERKKQIFKDPLFLTLLAGNLSSQDMIKTFC